MRFKPLCIAGSLLLNCVALYQATHAQPERNYPVALYSWRGVTGHFEFALLPQGDREEFLRRFNVHSRGIGSVAELKKHLCALPSSAYVGWMNSPRLGLIYPPPQIVDEIRGFARQNEIAFAVLPTIEEP